VADAADHPSALTGDLQHGSKENLVSDLDMLSSQNCAIALIDFQPAMYQGVQSHGRLTTLNNVQVLAKAAKLFGIPAVLSTVEAKNFAGPFMPEITELFPEHKVVDRTSMNAWLDGSFREPNRATDRKKLVLARNTVQKDSTSRCGDD
jgi:nicotinamidase-related amidase